MNSAISNGGVGAAAEESLRMALGERAGGEAFVLRGIRPLISYWADDMEKAARARGSTSLIPAHGPCSDLFRSAVTPNAHP